MHYIPFLLCQYDKGVASVCHASPYGSRFPGECLQLYVLLYTLLSIAMAAQALFDRYNAIQARLEALESHPAFKKPPSVALEERQIAILERIGRLAAALGIGADSAQPPASTRPRPTVTPDASPIQQKLEQELIDKGFSHFR